MGADAVLIAGLGSAGRRHAANLAALRPGWRIIGWHTSGSGSSEVAGCTKVVTTLEAALASQPFAAIIACPASLHVPIARTLAASGIHLFIEKPLSDSLEGVDELLTEGRERGLVLMVGYNFRFYEPLRTVRRAVDDGLIGRIQTARVEAARYLPEWRTGSDYRRSVTARRDLGGGVLLELSHELDYLRWICGEGHVVAAVLRQLSDLEIDVEDVADVLLELNNGAIANIHLDMLQRTPSRGCRIAGSAGTIVWSAEDHSVRAFTAASGQWLTLCEPDVTHWREMYRAALYHFFDCIETESEPVVTGFDGRRVVELVIAAKTRNDRHAR